MHLWGPLVRELELRLPQHCIPQVNTTELTYLLLFDCFLNINRKLTANLDRTFAPAPTPKPMKVFILQFKHKVKQKLVSKQQSLRTK